MLPINDRSLVYSPELMHEKLVCMQRMKQLVKVESLPYPFANQQFRLHSYNQVRGSPPDAANEIGPREVVRGPHLLTFTLTVQSQ